MPMHKEDVAVLCPLQLLEIHPFCDYPGVGKVIVKNELTPDQIEGMRVALHVFEHKFLTAGYEFYEKVPRPLGQDLLQLFLKIWAGELDKELKKAAAQKKK